MKSTILEVEGMTCGHCVKTIEGALREIGVSGNADLEKKTVFVEYDENEADIETIKGTVEKKGYKVK